jgi:peptide/nickel transport system ATP-binding protein
MSELCVENLSIVLGKNTILDNVSFSVEKGEVFGLVGESGSGKSTVLKCISGLYEHWQGVVAVRGANVSDLSRVTRSLKLQMVFQDPYGSLHPQKTIGSQLAEPLRIHRRSVKPQVLTDALGMVGLSAAFLHRYPHQISGGQRQRVVIARCLLLEPDILLLDEPTSALDVSVQAEILNLLSDLRERLGLTYILVSHDLAVIAHMCQHIAVMRQGKILEMVTRDILNEERQAAHPYTQGLIAASKGYDRTLAHTMSAGELG